MKKILILLLVLLNLNKFSAQVIYKETFGGQLLTLAPLSPTQASSSHTTIPQNYLLINDGFKNNVGSGLNLNKPFNNSYFKTTGWACVYNAQLNDTFLVSTSWLDSTANCNRWVITPPITIPNDTAVLTWNAMSPDPAFADGYEVYLTTNTTSSLTINDFTAGNLLFSINDNNTAGGGEAATWTKRSVSLAGRSGQTVRFAFRNNSRDRYQLWIDDIEVIRLQRATDAAATQVNYARYNLINSSQSVSLTVSALGSKPVNTISISYKIGSSFPVTEFFTLSPPLTYGQSRTLMFSAPFSISSPGNYAFKTWISTVNGVIDQNTFNDSLSGTISVQTTAPAKKVLLEQFVSAKDDKCSQAQTNLLSAQNNSVITIAVHDADSLKNHNASGLLLGYKTDLATAMIDRTYWTDKNDIALTSSQWAAKITDRLNKVSPVAVSIINKTYNASNRQLSFTVKADFVADVKGDYRLNAALVENNVYGPITDTTDNGFNQWNGSYFTSWSPYYQTGIFNVQAGTYLLIPTQFKHQRVLNYSFDGSFGVAGTIPSNGGTLNQSYTKTFTLTLPQSTNGAYQWNADNLYIVAYAAEYNFDKNKRNVLNATEEKLTTGNEVIGISETLFGSLDWIVYPNPASESVTVDLRSEKDASAEITDLGGKLLLKTDLTNGKGQLQLNTLHNGVYILRVKNSQGSGFRKLVINHQ